MSQALLAPQPPGSVAGESIVLQTRNLTKVYQQRTVVNQLNLDIQRGEIFGFLGPNGAGKTTTIRMILGLVTPEAGTVSILGEDAREHRARVLARVGALIETPALHLYMSGRDNLRAVAAITGTADDTRIDEVLDIVHLTPRQRDRVRTYSLGMKQRLGLAVALLDNPELLILDEPANGLDPAGIVEMRDLLRRLADQGKTIVISSHVLSEVQQICTRVGIIHQGKLITTATVAALTHGQGEFVVHVEDATHALAAIQAQVWGRTARLEHDGTIHTAAPNGRGRDLIRFLVQAGYAPDQVAFAQEQLEDVFLRLTGAAHGGQE